MMSFAVGVNAPPLPPCTSLNLTAVAATPRPPGEIALVGDAIVAPAVPISSGNDPTFGAVAEGDMGVSMVVALTTGLLGISF